MTGLKVLMTGGTGFLGSRLLPLLLSQGYDLTVLKRSFSSVARLGRVADCVTTVNIDEIRLERVFEERSFDLILHCATNYGRRVLDPIQVLEANLILPVRLIELGAEHGIRCFVNTDTIIDKRISQYSLSKSQFKEWLALYSERICCVNVALEHFYGPGDDDSKFLSSIIKKLISNAPGIDLTPGEQKRDFIYIDDVLEAFLAIVLRHRTDDRGYHCYEVGSGELASIREVVELAARILGNDTTQLRFGALPYRANEVMQSRVDTSALSGLGWEYRVPLREGLEKTIAYEKNQYTSRRA